MAFVMTKLISAILITLKPFGVNFEAWPRVYITLNLLFSVEDLCRVHSLNVKQSTFDSSVLLNIPPLFVFSQFMILQSDGGTVLSQRMHRIKPS